MDTQNTMTKNYLDVLFEGRNKSYGSYELRMNYPRRMKRALSLLLGGIACACGYAVFAGNNGAVPPVPVNMRECTLTIVEPPIITQRRPPAPEQPKPAAAKPTLKYTTPKVVPDKAVLKPEPAPTTLDLKNAVAGLTTADGDSSAGEAPIGKIGKPGGEPVVTPKPEIPVYVEEMPTAPYNVNQYLGKHINYPAAARENHIEGKVNIRFVVSEGGTISQVSAVGSRRVGGGLEEEAIRVVSGMPKWNPGKQNGRAVKVYFTLPVSFKLQ